MTDYYLTAYKRYSVYRYTSKWRSPQLFN